MGRPVGSSVHQSVGEPSVTALFPFLGNSWENLNMSIITEDCLLVSTEIFISFLSLLFLPVGQSAVLPSLALEEVRDSHSSPDVYPWQLQLLASASVVAEGRSCWLLFGLGWRGGNSLGASTKL